jgi:hypothetical protein
MLKLNSKAWMSLHGSYMDGGFENADAPGKFGWTTIFCCGRMHYGMLGLMKLINTKRYITMSSCLILH